MSVVHEGGITLTRRDVRVLLLYEFRMGHRATVAARNICCNMGSDVVSEREAQRWFKQFRDGQFDLDDLPRSGRPREINDEEIMDLVDGDTTISLRSCADLLGCSHTAVDKHLKALGKSWRYGTIVPHELTDVQLRARVDSCQRNLDSHRNLAWLSNVITADEKWVLYTNHSRKRQWLSPGQAGTPVHRDAKPKKVMICVWWGVKGIAHWETLPIGGTVNGELYCQQLDRVAASLKGIQDRVYFLHDNARPHVSKITNQKLADLKWEIVPHPPYSPDLAPSDYHLFRSMTHFLDGQTFEDESEVEIAVSDYFASLTPAFFERGILSLGERWRQVVANNGTYLV